MVMPRIWNKYRAGRKFGDPAISPRIGGEYQGLLTQLARDPDPFGDPAIMPRIGDAYQAEIPEVRENADHDPHFLVGLPVPLTSPMTRLDLNRSDPGDSLVPGINGESWSGAERDCFLLGLYVFEKDFVGVRRLVETKEMGAILSYYFGKFCSSSECFRWRECRKTKRFGRRMFSGQRGQELVNRMLPGLEVECREALFDVSTLYGDGKMSLVDYVVSLKALVGIDILVEAVGLGKCRRDLLDCSSLSPSEIVEFLRGDRRLSKARSGDLFWKAVWPRLRARGWRLERGGNQGCGGKGNLVFLTPHVENLCRKKLVKGDQYFDSTTEVLSRVAQDPGLIGLGSEGEPRPADASSSSNERLSSRVSARPSATFAGGSHTDSSENPRPHVPFDLNLPYSESKDIDFVMDSTNEQDVTSKDANDHHRAPDLEIRADVSQRRHSTRTRPPTARLIYDAAYGYNAGRRSYKRKEGGGGDDRSRPSRHARGVVGRVSARRTEEDETGAPDEQVSEEANEGADSKQ